MKETGRKPGSEIGENTHCQFLRFQNLLALCSVEGAVCSELNRCLNLQVGHGKPLDLPLLPFKMQ